jgi:NhaA family Na+:H+ antiporter
MNNEEKLIKDSTGKGIYHARWEKSFDKILTPFEEFIHRQTTSGLLLMGTAVIALILANSGFSAAYQHFTHTPVGFNFGGWAIQKTLHHWVNDGLMALFFFLVGLELKRELMVGELASFRNAALPIFAAIGGMLVPALIYLAINHEGDAALGWGIPMATDIAFAIGALALLANRVPKALITFLVALAIVDDLGAVVVIALFYTDQIVWQAIFIAAGLLALLIIFNLSGIRQPLPYFLFGIILWFALLKSGVHATLAGVLTAFTIPARPKYDPARFSRLVKKLMVRFDASYDPGKDIMTNTKLRGIVQTLENGVHKVETPLQRLEHSMHMPVAFIIIPVFALINAGIPIDFSGIAETLTHPVTMGVMAGLVLGKFIGIAGASWVALKLGVGQLPAQTSFSQIAGVSLLAGIGFTMSIFIADLGFAGQTEYLLMAKTGILIASLVAGAGGFIWLWFVSKK